MIVLSEKDVAALLPISDAIEVVQEAMIAVSAGKANLPLRSIMNVGERNKMGIMPGAIESPACYGVKLVSLFPDNPAAGYSSHQGAIVLFEAEHGSPVAMMNAGLLTALRTAAASAAATRSLARAESQTLAIIGTGEQALHHLDAICAVRAIRAIRVVGRDRAKAEAFAAQARQRHRQADVILFSEVREAVRDADIICTVTSSPEPVLFGDWVAAGAHLNVVGASIPSKAEIDAELVARSSYFVDYRPSTLAQAGEFIAARESGRIDDRHIRAEIGTVFAGEAPGRSSGDEITLYRSLGIAAQDLACAHYCMLKAIGSVHGTQVDI